MCLTLKQCFGKCHQNGSSIGILIGTISRWVCFGNCHLNGRPPSSISSSTQALWKVDSNVPEFVVILFL